MRIYTKKLIFRVVFQELLPALIGHEFILIVWLMIHPNLSRLLPVLFFFTLFLFLFYLCQCAQGELANQQISQINP
jgi:hypothetical protein